MDGQTVNKAEDIRREDPNNSEALFSLAERYRHGLGVEKDPEKAAELYEKAALKGHSYAAFTLGEMFYTGEEIERDVYKAKEWFENSGEPESIERRLDISDELMTDLTTEQIRAKFAELEKDVKAGDAYAMSELAGWYTDGRFIKPDLEKAKYWAKKAIKAGELDGYMRMALICDAEGDTKGFINWLQKGEDKHSVDCIYTLGRCYYEGIYVEKDLRKAVKYFQNASISALGETAAPDKIYQDTYLKAQKELDELIGSETEKNKAEEKSTSSYREPITYEIAAIFAAVLVCAVSVLFVKLGVGTNGQEAEIIVKDGILAILLELACAAGIVGITGVTFGLITLSFYDEYELGAFIGFPVGIAACVALLITRATQKVLFIVAAIIIAVMIIRAVYVKKNGR